jgi:putative membrane protein
MERRLYYGITWPAAVLTTLFGFWLIKYNPGYYLHAGWMHAKLGLVFVLWGYHLLCGHYLKLYSADKNRNSSRFYRFFNEMPTLFLIGIVLLVVLKPF